MTRSQTSERKARAYLRANRALEMRLQGFTPRQIATELGYARPQGARKVLQRALDRLCPVEDVEALRNLESERMDMMLQGLWELCVAGDIDAITTYLKLSERRAKLLGLDRPAKLALTDPDGENPFIGMSDDELFALVQEEHARLTNTETDSPPSGGPEV